jgi:glycosyltransferase involved in cell wall biosynthesis
MMFNESLVSVIIPCYNQGRFLVQAIESIRAQSNTDKEIIVVDDGSTDDTPAIAAGFRGVRCLSTKNRGLAIARNTGLEASKGSYVVFLDADDKLLPNALEDLLHSLTSNINYAFVYGHVKLIAQDGSTVATPQQAGIHANHYLELLRHNFIWTTGAVMYRRNVLESVGGFNPSLGGSADFDLNARIARLFPVCCCGSTVLEYRSHDESMSRDHALMLKDAVTARLLQWKFVKGSRLHEEALQCGIRRARGDYGEKLIDEVSEHIRRGNLCEATGGLLILLRYYPQGFVNRARRKVANLLLDAQN